MLIVCAVVGGCRHARSGATGPHDAGKRAEAAAAPRTTESGAALRPAEPGEARRQQSAPERTPALAGVERSVITRRFGGARTVELQSAGLRGGRRAWLVYRTGAELAPLLLARDTAGRLLWLHRHPIGGLAPPVTQLALASGTYGNVVLFSYDAPTHFVAARMWNGDGALLADYEVLQVADCKALSALYWPGHGWVVGAAARNSARLQLLSEMGDLTWNGLSGIRLATRWRAPSPLSLVSDTEHSVMVWRVGYLAAKPTAHSGDHLFVDRYDEKGQPLWTGPLDAGRLPARLARTDTRIVLKRLTPGTVRARVPAGSRFTVVVTSEGRVLKR